MLSLYMYKSKNKAIKDFLKTYRNKKFFKEGLKKDPSSYVMTMEMLAKLEKLKLHAGLAVLYPRPAYAGAAVAEGATRPNLPKPDCTARLNKRKITKRNEKVPLPGDVKEPYAQLEKIHMA